MQLFQDNLSEVLRGGTGTTYTTTGGSANAQPGGNTGQLQYNNGNVFGGVAGSNYDGNNLTLGNVANLRILGGTNGQVLTTDGAGNISFANIDLSDVIQPQFAFNVVTTGNNQSFQFNLLETFLNNTYASVFRNGLLVPASDYTISGNTLTLNVFAFSGDEVIVTATGAGGAGGGGGGNGTPGGSNTFVQYNDQGQFGGTSQFTFNEVTNTLFANNYSGNGYGLATINASNIQGVVANAGFSSLSANANFANLAANANFATLSANANYAPNANVANFSLVATNANNANIANTANISNTANYSNFAGRVTITDQPNITSVGTLSSLTVGGESNLGPVGNVIITGGLANQFLQTDGSGNLSWATVAAGSNTTPGGSNTQVQYNNDGNFAGSSQFTFSGGVVTAPTFSGSFSGNGNSLTSLQGSNVIGAVGLASVANTVSNAAQPNITSVGTLTSVNVAGVSNLGPVSNVKITGGTLGQFLQTDGNGNLSWATTSNGTTTNPGGVNTYVQFNDAGSFGGVSTLTFNKATNTLTVPNASVENHSVSNINVGTRANLGLVSNVKIGGGTSGFVLLTDGQSNLSWVNPATIPASTANFAQNAEQANNANYAGNSNYANTSNITNTANFANYAANVTVANQPVISTLGTLTGLNVAGVSNLGPNGNVKITGGSTGQVLSTDGAGNLSWTTTAVGTVSNVRAAVVANVVGGFNDQLGFSLDTTPNTGITSTGNITLRTPTVDWFRTLANIGNVANRNLTGNGAQVFLGNGAFGVANSGTVTSVSGGGGALGFALSGTVTTSGSLALTVPDVSSLRSNLNIGTVGNLNLNGNGSQILAGNGTFVPIPGGVTSVGGTGNGLGFSLGGTVTSAGNLTLTVPSGANLRDTLGLGNIVFSNLNGNNQQVFSGTGNWVTLPTGNGTVTNVAGNGSVLGFSLGGSVTTAGNITLTGPTDTQLRTSLNIGNVANANFNGNGINYLAGDGVFRNIFVDNSILSNVKYGTEYFISGSTTSGVHTMDVELSSINWLLNNTLTGNITLNVRGTSTNPLSNIISNSQLITVTLLISTGAIAYGVTAFQIDGVTTTAKWQGGTPTWAANSIYAVTATILRIGVGYSIYASASRYA